MWRVIVTLVLSVLLVLPATATAAPLEDVPADSVAGAGSYPHADSDGNRISDGLDAAVADAGPAELF